MLQDLGPQVYGQYPGVEASAPARRDIPATPYTLYVSPAGRDDNPGTQPAPFRTILRASRAARPGTTIRVAPGSYAGGFRTTASGTPAARIYYLSTEKWGARIVPPAQSANKMAWDNRGSYTDVIGFQVDGGPAQGGTRWRYGIYNGGSWAVIRDNWIHHVAQNVECTSEGGSAIGVDSYYRGEQAEVIGNLVHDIGPPGCHYVQGIYVSTSGAVRNNVVYRVAQGAIHLWHDARDVVVSNNTVAASGSGIIVGGGDFYYTAAGADNVHVHNNIVFDNKHGISERGRTGLNNTYRNNLVFQNKIDWKLRNGLSHHGTVSAAPRFVRYARDGTPDFRLSDGSPAIGKGNTSFFVLPYDFGGNARSSGAGVDIGAWQSPAAR